MLHPKKLTTYEIKVIFYIFRKKEKKCLKQKSYKLLKISHFFIFLVKQKLKNVKKNLTNY